MECTRMLASRCTAEHIKIFLKKTRILGMCMGERKKELANGRKLWWITRTVHGCAGHLSLAFSIFSSISPFYHDNRYSCEFSIVHSLFYSILSLLILVLTSSSLLFYTHSSRFPHSLISYFYVLPVHKRVFTLQLRVA